MVDAVVTVFLEKLLNAFSEGSQILNEFKDEFEKLRSELQLMQSFFKDADRLKRKNHTLREIMVGLRELIYEAEDILADCQLHSKDDDRFPSGFSMCFYPVKLSFQYQTGKRLKEINARITNIKNNISSYLGVPLLAQPQTANALDQELLRWSSPIYDHTQVVGLESDTKKIKDWLFEANHGILAIGIVGMGGVGKTTIAQKVFNDREVEERFERRMWVSVSQTFTEEYIMRSMLRNLGDASVGDDRSELLRKINQYLLGKRYLIVMDDVWSLDNTWWLRIYEGLPKGNGSSIIITTRIEEVAQRMGVKSARTHLPKFLSKDDSWLLFRKIAFAASGGECYYPELVSIGGDIVEKCKGLPLAIKAVGGIMLCKPPNYHEWKRIAKHFRDELVENDNSVMASLQLSYDELPSYLKSCFLCVSLYPEDCVITKEQLVYWWIGEGFVPLRNGKLSIEAGEDCFYGLTNRCLMEVVDKSYNGTIPTCKIHDMVRDLAIKMAEDDMFSGPDRQCCRRLAIKSDVDQKQWTPNQHLRAMLSTTKSGEVNMIASSTVKRLYTYRYLRVLDLSKSIFETPLACLLDQIGSLKHLACVSLSNTHPLIQFPPSLKNVSCLQILDVSHCQNLKMLPPYITMFQKLIVLDVSHCGSLEYLPKGLGRLSSLQALLGFRPARSNEPKGSSLSELRSLTRLRTLGLQLMQADEIADNEVDALLFLQELQFLAISCFDSHGNDLVDKLEKLSPPPQLHELCLKFYPGTRSPRWLNPFSLPMLRHLAMSSGNIAKMHESFWGHENSVWKIEGLMLESLSDLGEEWSSVCRVMPCLRIVNASWCPHLGSFPIEDVAFKGGVWKKEEQRS
ncbi:disease resistance RPP13-like protein 4 isoform X2 [Malania oleifera]|nr:disease resistance RPP13-like protein 4 isoform X2 [Malania oleifera]XP_057967478.1 disease resistance RPP13-like protein 4 isoform X2 [Malania oleifera]XP_057967486.1 disease resistance RPP13-like protein 4 isoform X2 [Malania oleifera]XP_057967491.1 disease resistance RPP13-like protein 4 isoform X2 [Malania oleifera]XP_057967501.1 disease resistance RPP13-like protein 4 isoform X2 [Malania oleifera]XP_057967511.1 disease resistance RPP13-like protein 4 isoform X2 [Malania oleifera]